MTLENAIECLNLKHSFGIGQTKTAVLHSVSLCIERGEVVVLRGASGSGKTTLLTLLACLRSVQSGQVTVLGQRIDRASDSKLMEIRRRLGFIFQSHNLHPALTAIQNVRMGLELHGPVPMSRWREGSSHLLAALGLADRLDYRPSELSGGQKQRVAIARALVGNPEMVFADEPTAALDSASSALVIDLLKELARTRDTATLIVTHDSRIIDQADRVITLADGQIVE